MQEVIDMLNSLMPSPSERAILDHLSNGVCCVDRGGQITYWNKTAQLISGYEPEEMLGKSCKKDLRAYASGVEEMCEARCPLAANLSDFKPASILVNLRHRNGSRIPTQIRCLPLLDTQNDLIGAIEILERSSFKQSLNNHLDELQHIAYFDALTGSPNRRYMEEALDDCLAAYLTGNREFVLIMADVDYFKTINDSYGHDVGDRVLKRLTMTLGGRLRSDDIVCRWGGDEFMILLQNFKPGTDKDLTEKLAHKLDELRREAESASIRIGGVPLKVTMSFGCTVPRKNDTAATLLERVDSCLYKSKREGRNRCSLDV